MLLRNTPSPRTTTYVVWLIVYLCRREDPSLPHAPHISFAQAGACTTSDYLSKILFGRVLHAGAWMYLTSMAPDPDPHLDLFTLPARPSIQVVNQSINQSIDQSIDLFIQSILRSIRTSNLQRNSRLSVIPRRLPPSTRLQFHPHRLPGSNCFSSSWRSLFPALPVPFPSLTPSVATT